MKRIDTSTRAVDLFGAGKDGFKDGNLALGVAPTDFNAAWPNGVQEELLGIVEEAGIAPSGGDLKQVVKALRQLFAPVARVVGLVGAPSSTTQMQLAAASVTMRNPSNGAVATATPVAAIMNNISTAGPVANGRDQAAAFSTGAWVHYFFIWNGTTLATIASLSTTAPTLPSGYTHYAYAATMLMGSSILTPMRYRGDKAFYDTSIQTVAGAGNTTETLNLVTATVPPNAPTLFLMVNMGLATNASGASGSNLAIRHTSGANFLNVTVSVAVANQTAWNSGEIELPNISQQFYFLFFNETTPANIAARQAFINVLGFTMPNGG